jgi:hypothetical protein
MSQYASTGVHYVHDHSRIAWVALGAAVAVGLTFLILALAGAFSTDDSSALPTSSGSGGSPTVQYNGGHEEGQAGVSQSSASTYNGGPEEGQAGTFGGAR